MIEMLKSSETLSNCILNEDFGHHEDVLSVSLGSKTFFLTLQIPGDADMGVRCDIAVYDQPPKRGLSRSQDSADGNNLRLKMKLLGKVIIKPGIHDSYSLRSD